MDYGFSVAPNACHGQGLDKRSQNSSRDSKILTTAEA
jgi:hypothetical protein